MSFLRKPLSPSIYGRTQLSYQKVSYFPATPETIVNYINDLADYAKANTISRRISAISENFNASGQRDNPCMAPIVKQALRGIRRLKGTFQQGKTPVLLEDIEDIIDCMTKLDVPELQLLRDKAILLIGFMGAFRRSEIAAITVENLQFSPQGVEIFVASSKADQEGQGAVVAIPHLSGSPLDAVRAVLLVLLRDLYLEGLQKICLYVKQLYPIR